MRFAKLVLKRVIYFRLWGTFRGKKSFINKGQKRNGKTTLLSKKYIVCTFVFTVFMSILGFKKIHIKNHFHFSREKKSLKIFFKETSR